MRLPENVVNALKDKAEREGVSSTFVATLILKKGLGLESFSDTANQDLESRVTELEAKIQEIAKG